MAKASLAVRGDLGSEITAQEFIGELDGLSHLDEFTLYVNSSGGSVFEALAMMAALNRSPARKIVEIEGIAASAATFLVAAGDEIRMHESSFFMVHQSVGGLIGNKHDMRQEADVLAQIDNTIGGIYASRSGGNKSDWMAAIEAETWLTAAEMAALGLASVIPNKGPAGATQHTAKASRSIANRSPAVRAIVDRLASRRTPARPVDPHVKSRMAAIAARAAEVWQDQLKLDREANRERIVRNATSPAQAKRYLPWS